MTKPDTRSPVSFEAWFQSQNPSLPLQGVRAVLELSAGGSTLPFIARYRKEATGNLDEVAIGLILDAKETYDQLRERQVYVLGEIEKQGKLTDALKAEIESCFHKQKLEDLYLPFKQKRKSKASKAREAGLEPLANWLWEVAHGVIQPELGQTLELWALTFRNEPMGYADVDAVLEGAGDILIERLSENAVLRERIRAMVFNEAFLRTEKGAKVKPNSKFEPYFDYQEKIQSLLEPSSSHRYLAIRRGWIEEELKLDVTGGKEDPAFEERLLSVFEDETAANADSALEEKGKALLKRCARLALKAHVLPSIENEAHAALKSASDEIAIHVFSENVRKLLLASPFGPKSVLGVDPGVRTGCKCAWIDQTGKYLASFVMQLQTDEGKADAKEKLSQLSGLDQIRCIAVGNGTAGRETEIFVRQTLQELGAQIPVVMVNEAGASVYSASETARAEFPDLDVTVRGAISIGRRLQDPLAELVKIDPKSIGVGQYQHDVSQPALKRSLERVVDSCVNSVGVNLNTASEYVLARVSGIGEGLAKAIVSHRAEKGLFEARRSLLDVPRFSQKVFEQAAGFLRVPESGNPLDATGVHPEQYAVLEEFVASQGKTVKDVVGSGVALVRESKELREKLGEFSFADIVKELERPGRDPRDVFVPFQYRADIHALADLKPEMLCPGIVTNVTTFGAFVDIGVHQDGLVHISQLANQFVKDPSQVVSPGDRVQVKVLEVNLEKKQISLSMKLGEPAQAGARGGRGKSSARSAEEDSGSGQPRRKPSFQRADEATSAGAGSGDSRFGGGSGGERGGRRGPGSRDGGRGAGRGGRDERLNEVSVPAARDYGDRGPARTSGFAGGRGGSSGAAGRGGASGGFGGRGASGGGRERGGSPEKRSSASGASAGSRASGGAGASRGAGAGMRSEPKKDQPAFNNPFAALASLKKPQ